jgi:hypothetical protein
VVLLGVDHTSHHFTLERQLDENICPLGAESCGLAECRAFRVLGWI